MKSLHERLDPIKDEVLTYTRNYGHFKSMTKFKVSDYTCFIRWLLDVTGDENFGVRPILGANNYQSLGDQLVEAFLRKVAALDTQNEKLRKENEQLEWLISKRNEKEELQALAVAGACEM